MLEPHYQDVYQNYIKNPSPKTSGPLLHALKPVIDESLRSYAGTEAQTVTAAARAKVLALEAVQRYDPNRAKLRTHLLSHLRGLRRSVERSTAGVYVPESWRLDARKVDATLRDMRDELGREPSTAELADRTKIPIARIVKARQVPGVLIGGNYESGVALDKPNEAAWLKWLDGIYHDSSGVDQIILEHTFGLHGKPILPGNEIARMVKLSPGAISQRKLRLQREVDQYDTFMYGRSHS